MASRGAIVLPPSLESHEICAVEPLGRFSITRWRLVASRQSHRRNNTHQIRFCASFCSIYCRLIDTVPGQRCVSDRMGLMTIEDRWSYAMYTVQLPDQGS